MSNAFIARNNAFICDFRPQRQNLNKHTPRGLGALEKSIQRDGWVGAITVAADGETFDGSARLEVAASVGFEDAIVIDSDGSRPIVLRRIDIPTADDPRARRLGLAANRVAELNLTWDVEQMATLLLDDPTLTDGFFTDKELDAIAQEHVVAQEQWESPRRQGFGVLVTLSNDGERVAFIRRMKLEGVRCREL